MRIKLTNMLSIFADSLGQASNFQSIAINGCSPAANLIFPACLGKCLVSNKSSLYTSCEEFKHSKSFVARARLLQIQIGADCLCRRRALATKAHRFRLVRLRRLPKGTTSGNPLEPQLAQAQADCAVNAARTTGYRRTVLADESILLLTIKQPFALPDRRGQAKKQSGPHQYIAARCWLNRL